MRLKQKISQKTYTQEELYDILRFFIENTRGDKPWVDADDEWFEQFLQPNNMKRRDLSGIYIFEQFEGEEKRQPTCFEDCTEATQDKWLDTLEIEALKNLSKQLAGTLIGVADFAGITRNNNEYK